MNLKSAAERFYNFAVSECKGSSDLYRELSLQISEDRDLLQLSLSAREGQPIPNLLLGSVHYLLLKGYDHKLREYYPSITDNARQDNQLFAAFKNFCQENLEELTFLMKNKLVQTNEVRRCAYLYPVFCYIYNQTNRPLSLVEIGTSAGLQLLWDQYSYSYDNQDSYGNEDSFVHLTSTVREGKLPHELLTSTPPVNDRRGIDLHVSDLTNEEEYLWLKALIWPEHTDRLNNLEDASKQLRDNPPNLIEGDGVKLLLKVIEGLPLHTMLCIFHTHVANQLPAEVKDNLRQQISDISKSREVFHIYNNMEDWKLHIDYVSNGKVERKTVGETDGHGRWFDWKLLADVLV
ncbi:DUF2332 domain-containing protein [Thalassobacillus hwangdonensis]|uniref:DUF2332 domain-containing protein n=1 Tax=Thalassobacillus hwangdonensis TaxID=546108 RepID=A0ABW3L504_9BACI